MRYLFFFAHLEASVSPGKVTTGVPVQRTSIDVVWPLQSGVSKQTSANWPRRTCSSLAATFEKMIRPGPKPLNRDRGKCKLYIRKSLDKRFAVINFLTFSTHQDAVWFAVYSVRRPRGIEATTKLRSEHSSKL